MKNLRILFALIIISPFSYSQNLDEKLDEVKYRNIGPFRGGRSVASVGVIGDPLTYYMGTVGGGLWKTTNPPSGPFHRVGFLEMKPSQPDPIVYFTKSRAYILTNRYPSLILNRRCFILQKHFLESLKFAFGPPIFLLLSPVLRSIFIGD